MWYFDKKYGELRYRLIGIQPVGYVEFDLNSAQIDFESGLTQNKPTPKALFWLWYRDIRDILHKHYVFSDKNNSKRISFDQLLLSRKFHTYLYRIDNVMDDRELIDTPYINNDPYLRITESQRLKEIIRNFEHDMEQLVANSCCHTTLNIVLIYIKPLDYIIVGLGLSAISLSQKILSHQKSFCCHRPWSTIRQSGWISTIQSDCY